MKLTARYLRKIIAEEIQKQKRQSVILEGTQENPIQVTPRILNQIIKEEFEAYQRHQRIQESRRRRY